MDKTHPDVERMLRERFPDGVPLIPVPVDSRPVITDLFHRDRPAVHEAGRCWCRGGADCPGEPAQPDPWAGVLDALNDVTAHARDRHEVVRLTPDQVTLLRLAQHEPRWAWEPGSLGRTLGALVGVPLEIVDDHEQSTPALLARARRAGAAVPNTLPPRGAQLMRPAHTGPAPVEAKVKTSTLVSAVSAAVLVLVSRYAFAGGAVPDALSVAVSTVVGGVATGLLTFVTGFLTRHAPRWVKVETDDVPGTEV